MTLALIVAAECFVAPSLSAARHGQPHATEPKHLTEMKARNRGDNMVWFGKYADEKTWDEVLRDDPGYCSWVLMQRGQRFLSYPGARELQEWLREQKTTAERSVSSPEKDVWLFHYTNTESAKEIMSSGCLMPSIQAISGDALGGDGVYFTELQQATPYLTLHDNNYDGARRLRGQEAYVRVRREKMPGVVRVSTSLDRNVWVLPTKKPLDLAKAGAELSWKRPRHGDTTVYRFYRRVPNLR